MLVKASVGCGEGRGVGQGSGCWPWVPFHHEEHENRMAGAAAGPGFMICWTVCIYRLGTQWRSTKYKICIFHSCLCSKVIGEERVLQPEWLFAALCPK